MQRPPTMRHVVFAVAIVFWIFSCKDKSDVSRDAHSVKPDDTLSADEAPLDAISNPEISSAEFARAFTKAVEAFPKDSASLFQFYYEQGQSKYPEQLDRQIERFEKLT